MNDKNLEKLINIETKINKIERKQKILGMKLDRIEDKIDKIYNLPKSILEQYRVKL